MIVTELHRVLPCSKKRTGKIQQFLLIFLARSFSKDSFRNHRYKIKTNYTLYLLK